jgi:hypothetical protein
MFRTSEWGARPAQHDSAATVPTDMVLHHTATPNRPPIARHDAAVQRLFELARTIQADHMNRGFADTGQHFTVSSDGICCEGRHGSLDALLAGRCIRGAHAADSDTGADDNDSWGTEHEGTYGTVQMPRPQWEASVHLHAVIAMRCNLDSATIIGHRDTRCITACPGDAFHARIPQFRADVHRKILELRAAVPV